MATCSDLGSKRVGIRSVEMWVLLQPLLVLPVPDGGGGFFVDEGSVFLLFMCAYKNAVVLVITPPPLVNLPPPPPPQKKTPKQTTQYFFAQSLFRCCKTETETKTKRMWPLLFLLQMLDETLRQFIAFIKTVPGFSQLSMRDQIRLIKGMHKQSYR